MEHNDIYEDAIFVESFTKRKNIIEQESRFRLRKTAFVKSGMKRLQKWKDTWGRIKSTMARSLKRAHSKYSNLTITCCRSSHVRRRKTLSPWKQWKGVGLRYLETQLSYFGAIFDYLSLAGLFLKAFILSKNVIQLNCM